MTGSPQEQNFSRYPMLQLATAFAIGIVVSNANVITIPVSVIVVILLLAGCAATTRGTAFLVLLLFIPLGTICNEVENASIAADRIRRLYDERVIESHAPVEIEGVLESFPEPAFDGSFLKLRVEKITFRETEWRASGRVRLFVAGQDEEGSIGELRYGSIVRIACRLEREERYLNPGVASRIQMLDSQGIDGVATVKSSRLIEKIGEDSVFLPLAWVYERRKNLLQAFRETFSPPTAGVMIASLLGNKHFLDRDTAETFREGGTFHVLVISGLHITFIGGFTLWLVSWFTKRPVWQSILVTGFLWAYTLAVGAEIPVVRASLMFTLILISRLLYRQGSLLNTLGTCTLLLLAWRPSDLFSASFQLTFVSVAAIVGCAFPLIEKLRAIGSWAPTREKPLPALVGNNFRRFCESLYWNECEWRIEKRRHIWTAGLFKSPYFGWEARPNLQAAAGYVFEGLLVSLIVQIWMLPLLIFYFHRVAPAGLLLNLWVGFLLAIESFAAMAAIIVGTFSPWIAMPLTGVTELLNSLMMSVPLAVSLADAADPRIPVYPGAGKLLYCLYSAAVVVTAMWVLRWQPFQFAASSRGKRGAVVSIAFVALLGLVIVCHPFSSPAADGRFRIDFLDVGQGDAALVTFPDGRTMLVDGGGQPDFRDGLTEFQPDVQRIGESVVSEFLWEKGYSRVDFIVGTHADADHIQGLVDVAQNFDVGTLLLGTVEGAQPDLVKLLGIAARKGVPVETLQRGDIFDVSGVTIRVLHPSSNPAHLRSTNNNSIVLHFEFGSHSFLLTGDIENEAESELIRIAPLGADVVKVAHHGSRTSSTQDFVDRTGATTAVISVGKRSRFDHPHREVVGRWQSSGATVMATGERGTITVESDAETLETRRFRP